MSHFHSCGVFRNAVLEIAKESNLRESLVGWLEKCLSGIKVTITFAWQLLSAGGRGLLADIGFAVEHFRQVVIIHCSLAYDGRLCASGVPSDNGGKVVLGDTDRQQGQLFFLAS